jgi:hypothetical protein
MSYPSAYLYELQQMMGSSTSEAEALAMADILKERGLDPQKISHSHFFAVVAEAVERAKPKIYASADRECCSFHRTGGFKDVPCGKDRL